MSKAKILGRKYAFLLLIVLLLAMLASYTLAQETAPETAVSLSKNSSPARINRSGMANGMVESWLVMHEQPASGPLLRARSGSPAPPSTIQIPLATTSFETHSLTGATACSNVITNSQLNILEFGDGTGTAEPWVFLEPIVYYLHEDSPDFPGWAYDGYSLVFQDGDAADPSPTWDMFVQGFLMPKNLTEVTVEYWRATDLGNSKDFVYGELWLLDKDGYLRLDEPDKYFVGTWEVSESEQLWKMEVVSTTKGMVNELSGQWAAVLFFNITDGSLPSAPEKQKEWMLMDDITVTACYKPATTGAKKAYLPTVQKAGSVAPFCVPPSENPRDEYHSNRGHTQTGANCKSSLSNVDKADYYTFKPNKSGSHTLHLRNLPKDTEWSAMIFVDTDQPSYAPGDGDGKCHINTPGSVDKKVTCDLKKDKSYFIKVSAGSTPKLGNYEMKVVTP